MDTAAIRLWWTLRFPGAQPELLVVSQVWGLISPIAPCMAELSPAARTRLQQWDPGGSPAANAAFWVVAASCHGPTARGPPGQGAKGRGQKEGGCAAGTPRLGSWHAPHRREPTGLFLPTLGSPPMPLNPPGRAPRAAAWGQAGCSGPVRPPPPRHPIAGASSSSLLTPKQQTVPALPPLAPLPSSPWLM